MVICQLRVKPMVTHGHFTQLSQRQSRALRDPSCSTTRISQRMRIASCLSIRKARSGMAVPGLGAKARGDDHYQTEACA